MRWKQSLGKASPHCGRRLAWTIGMSPTLSTGLCLNELRELAVRGDLQARLAGMAAAESGLGVRELRAGQRSPSLVAEQVGMNGRA